jgi:hypothetical protein
MHMFMLIKYIMHVCVFLIFRLCYHCYHVSVREISSETMILVPVLAIRKALQLLVYCFLSVLIHKNLKSTCY